MLTYIQAQLIHCIRSWCIHLGGSSGMHEISTWQPDRTAQASCILQPDCILLLHHDYFLAIHACLVPLFHYLVRLHALLILCLSELRTTTVQSGASTSTPVNLNICAVFFLGKLKLQQKMLLHPYVMHHSSLCNTMYPKSVSMAYLLT